MGHRRGLHSIGDIVKKAILQPLDIKTIYCVVIFKGLEQQKPFCAV